MQQLLRASLSQGLGQPNLPLRDVAIRAWSLSVTGGLEAEDWDRVIGCIRKRYGFGFGGVESEFDDMAALFLLHAAMLSVGGTRSWSVIAPRKSNIWADVS